MEIRRIVKSRWLAALLLVAPCLGTVDSAAQGEPAETEAADTVGQPAGIGRADTLAEPVGTVAADTLVDDAGSTSQDVSDHGQDVADIKVGVEEISQGVQTILRTITLGHLLFAGLVFTAAGNLSAWCFPGPIRSKFFSARFSRWQAGEIALAGCNKL